VRRCIRIEVESDAGVCHDALVTLTNASPPRKNNVHAIDSGWTTAGALPIDRGRKTLPHLSTVEIASLRASVGSAGG